MAVQYFLYSVKDRKGSFMDPVPLLSDGIALRSFSAFLEQVKETDSSAISVPYTDLELYRLGSFDLSSGIISPEMPVLLATSSIVDHLDLEVSDAE